MRKLRLKSEEEPVKAGEEAGTMHPDPIRLQPLDSERARPEPGHPQPLQADPVHPGEVLREEFMRPLGLSANALAIALRVPVTRISEIVRERRAISVETAMRLGLYFGTSTEYWIDVQKTWELAIARDMLPRIQAEVRPAAGEWKDRKKPKGIR